MAEKLKNKPDFIIIGSMKSGTTTLYNDLSKLKALHLPADKEPAILVKYSEKVEIEKQYREHFKGADSNQLCGEASTAYTSMPMYNGMVERALKICGKKLKLIMVMRDPVERIYSHLRHDVAGGHIDVNEIDHLVLNDQRYLAISNYAMQLKPWIDAFGVENLYCVSFIKLQMDRQQVVRDIATFLDVGVEEFKLENGISNQSSELRKTGKKMSFVINSRFYRNYIRPIMSDDIRSRVRALLLPKVVLPEIKLSESVKKELKNKLINTEEEIELLLGKPIKINKVKG